MVREKEITVETVNENLLNIITPPGVDFTATNTNLGENFGKIYCISRYPSNGVNTGWLAPLCSLEGSMTCMEYRHTSPDRMTKVMNKRIRELKDRRETVKEESERQTIDKAIKDIREMINRISVKNEPVGYVNTMVFVQASTENDLNARIKKVTSQVAIEECNLKILKYRQREACRSIAPYGIPDYKNVSNMGERNMPISTFIGGFPMANSGLNDNGGYYLGRTKNDRIVRINQWLRKRDRTNSNWFITGVPGTGKSTTLKTLITKEFALGCKVIIFDPEQEYTDLARRAEINGDIISCGGGANGRINPLQIRPSAKFSPDEIEEIKRELGPDETLEDYIAFDNLHGQSDLYIHLQQLRVFFRLYLGDEFTAIMKALLERTLIELYESFGISKDADVRKFKNDQFPIMEDLYRLLKQKADEKVNNANGIEDQKEYRKLALLLESIAVGADSGIWNGYTTLNSSSDFIDLDVSTLLDLDDNVKRAQFYNITMWAWGEMSRDRSEKVLFVIDEGYLFVDPEYPDLMKNIRNISKRDRKYEGGLMFITHSCVDVLDESVRRYGQALVDNATYKFIMGTDGKNLQETTKLFDLSDQEEIILAAKNRGQGIFFCGGTRMDLRVEVCDELLAMFGSAGGR